MVTKDKIVRLWYKLVASSLLKDNERLYDNYQTLLDQYCKNANDLSQCKIDLLAVKHELAEWKDRANPNNTRAAIATQAMKERLRGEGPMPSVLTNRDHAVRQRIRDLESENAILRKYNTNKDAGIR